MSKKKISNLALILICVILGGLMVIISLLAANRAVTQDSASFASKKLYFSSEILPDNLIYPVFMMLDKIAMDRASKQEKLGLEVAYAGKRLDSACKLLEKDQLLYQPLAISTMNKSKEYMLGAVEHVIDGTDQQRLGIADVIERHIQAMESCRNQYQINSPEIDEMIQELRVAKIGLLPQN